MGMRRTKSHPLSQAGENYRGDMNPLLIVGSGVVDMVEEAFGRGGDESCSFV